MGIKRDVLVSVYKCIQVYHYIINLDFEFKLPRADTKG